MHDVDFGNGYISDVPSQNSNTMSDSEGSHNLRMTPARSKPYSEKDKEKFDLLKNAYKQRLDKLNTVIENSFEKLLVDDVFSGMKQDSITASFVPSYISEFLETHMRNDREELILQSSEKISVLESDLRKNRLSLEQCRGENQQLQKELKASQTVAGKLEPLQQKVMKLESAYKELESQSQHRVFELTNQLDEATEKSVTLHKQLSEVST